MRVWHVGAGFREGAVDGLAATTAELASAQTRLGIHVDVIVDHPIGDLERSRLEAYGFNVLSVRGTRNGYVARDLWTALRQHRPDVVHMHSTFVRRQAILAVLLRIVRIPYVVQPHGSFAPAALKRSGRLKGVYSRLVERPRLRGARAVLALTPGEVDDIIGFCGHGQIFHIDVAVSLPRDVEDLDPPRVDPANVLLLGRLDATHKGLDRLPDLARCMPSTTFDVYGSADHRSPGLGAHLTSASPNITIHEPVFGPEKYEVLKSAALVLFLSRWEGFPVSAAEAMLMGVPCALPAETHAAQYASADLAAICLPPEAEQAAAVLSRVLASEEERRQLSKAGTAFARRFAPERVAALTQTIYEKVSAGRSVQ